MADLDKLRKDIDSVDRELTKAFIRRMELCKKIRKHKKENSLPIRDFEREAEVIKNMGKLCGEYKDYGERLYRTIIDISCELQESLDE